MMAFQNGTIPMAAVSIRRLGILLVIGSFLFLVGCDSGGSSAPDSVDGRWHGSIDTDSVSYQLSFDLRRVEAGTATGARWEGEGELVGGADTWEFLITDGLFTKPNFFLSLTFRFNEIPRPILLEGTVGDEYQEISADITGGPPQFDERSLTLSRP